MDDLCSVTFLVGPDHLQIKFHDSAEYDLFLQKFESVSLTTALNSIRTVTKQNPISLSTIESSFSSLPGWFSPYFLLSFTFSFLYLRYFV